MTHFQSAMITHHVPSRSNSIREKTEYHLMVWENMTHQLNEIAVQCEYLAVTLHPLWRDFHRSYYLKERGKILG